MNQCDGCRANVETYTREGITYHVMDRTELVGRNGRKFPWTDLMICERSKYERDDAGNEIYIGGEPPDGDDPR
jgi:hypothetical protein